MSANCSFDVVSDFDRQELVNALDQTLREIKSRYDLKDTKTTVELVEDKLIINTSSDLTLQSVQDVLRTKAAKRNLSQKIFEYGNPEEVGGNRIKQEITLKKGINAELAKKISKMIRDNFKKVQASIQGDAVRVSAKSKDDLQAVIQYLKQEDWMIELQFINYR